MMRRALPTLGYAGAIIALAMSGTAQAAILSEELKPQGCGEIDRFALAIAPLPTAKMRKMVAPMLKIGLARDKTVSLPICLAGQQQQ